MSSQSVRISRAKTSYNLEIDAFKRQAAKCGADITYLSDMPNFGYVAVECSLEDLQAICEIRQYWEFFEDSIMYALKGKE